MEDIIKLLNGNGLSGITNMGNTCFLNSVIQLLSNCKLLTYYFISEDYTKDINDKNEKKFVNTYAKMMDALWEDNCIIQPEGFYSSLCSFFPEYKMKEQQDAQEVLIRILDLLHNGLSYKINTTFLLNNSQLSQKIIKKYEMAHEYITNSYKNQYSYIYDLFNGLTINYMKCPRCNKKKYNFEGFGILSLDVTENTHTLNDCFKTAFREEELDFDGKWVCEYCNKKSNPIRKIMLWSLPKYIIIQLKRFNMTFNKVNKYIHFPIQNLSLSDFTQELKSKQFKYNLVGICNHQGSNLNGGHYTSYCKNVNDQWYLFDDDEEMIEVNDENMMVTSKAYLLVYEINF